MADLGGKSHSDEKRGATHRLVGFHDRRHRPFRHDGSELLLEPTQALERVLDRVDGFLKDVLQGRLMTTRKRKYTPIPLPATRQSRRGWRQKLFVASNGTERASMETATIIGLDLAKRSFQANGAQADGSVAFRKKLTREKSSAFLPSRRAASSPWRPAGAPITGVGLSAHRAKPVPPEPDGPPTSGLARTTIHRIVTAASCVAISVARFSIRNSRKPRPWAFTTLAVSR